MFPGREKNNFFRWLISMFQIPKIIKIWGCAEIACFGVPKSIIKPQNHCLVLYRINDPKVKHHPPSIPIKPRSSGL